MGMLDKKQSTIAISAASRRVRSQRSHRTRSIVQRPLFFVFKIKRVYHENVSDYTHENYIALATNQVIRIIGANSMQIHNRDGEESKC